MRHQWRTEVRRYEGQPKPTAARSQKAGPAATLRTGTAGSQDESRCSAIHKFNFRFKGNRAGETPALRTAARGQKKLPKGFSFGRLAYPRMDIVRFGEALLPAQLAWLDAERAAAAAGALDVRVIEFKARTFDCLDVINLHTV